MKKFITGLLALLICGMVLGMTACASGSATEQAEEKTEIRIPEPVKYEKCTELGTPLADVRVRRALAHAIDVDTVIEALYYGTGESAADHAYDPELAKTLLAEAGWPSDYVLDVVYSREHAQFADLLSVVVHYWDAVGVKAEIRPVDEDQLWTAPADGEDDASVEWDLALYAVTNLTELHFAQRFASDSPANSHTPEIDGLDETIAAGDAALALQILDEQVSYIPVIDRNNFVCVSDHLQTGAMTPGIDRYAYDKDVLNWTTDREDKTLYTGEAPASGGLAPMADPGQLYFELVFDTLLDMDAERNPASGRIAENYTADGNTVTFTLREDLLWHDGEPLTAEDVKFTFELYLRCADTDPVLATLLEKLEGAQSFVDGDAEDCAGITVEENTVNFRFAETAEDALTVFSQWPILPKHKLENVKISKLMTHKFWENPVGSGPFRVAELKPGKTALLERWADYPLTGDGNIDFVRMNASGEGLAVLAARDLLDYGWGCASDDEAYIRGLENMEVMAVEHGCTLCFFVNQFPHASYFAVEESTEPTE